jgi:hypothetical protein
MARVSYGFGPVKIREYSYNYGFHARALLERPEYLA